MGAAGRAVLLPGSSPAWSRTLLDVTGLALTDAGWETHPLWWDPPGTGDPTAWVEAQLADALAGLPADPAPRLVVGKSLGTRATAYAAERGWPGVWLTPLLRDPACVAGIAANPAPQLLVGGLADELYDAEVAAALAADDATAATVVEVPAGDHSLHVATDAVASAEALVALARAVTDFGRGLRAGAG